MINDLEASYSMPIIFLNCFLKIINTQGIIAAKKQTQTSFCAFKLSFNFNMQKTARRIQHKEKSPSNIWCLYL
ncbi:hypothetical protein [Treponema sp. R6D11]